MSSHPDSADTRYFVDETRLQKIRSEAPWMKDPKFFKNVALSPSAVMKIMMHCQSGVEKGIAKGGNPVEVMGMLLGRPDPDTPETLVVTDAFPLPIEGFETRVVADDENVVNHMIALGESLERTRREKFMGWYHSHPFNLSEHSHCFLSQTDVTTQLQWQRAEDPHGNPFVAIVVDPLRSMHQQVPELKAFRAYPPEYNAPIVNECPNGTIEPSEQLRLEQWGSCWNRYYALDVDFFMSSTSRKLLETLTKDYLWMRTLDSQSESVLTSELVDASKLFQHASTMPLVAAATSSAGSGVSTGSSATAGNRGAAPSTRAVAASQPITLDVSKPNQRAKEWSKAVHKLEDVAVDQLGQVVLEVTKKQVFG